MTAQNLHFYSHYLGLVFTHTMPLYTISEVKAAPEKECDYLFLHMKPVSSDDDEAEMGLITIKVFLEPLRLLQRRIDLLVKNSHNKVGSEKDPRLNSRELLQRLVAMEKEVEHGQSSDQGSWEDVGLYMDGHHDGRREAGEIKLNIADHTEEKKPDGKVKLPAAPVEYIPPGMTRKSLEREFSVSPKVLFHVMFGEKSSVFQTLYANRRSKQPVQQVAWKEIDKGRARRTFAYNATFLDIFGRNRRADIEDHQTIEKQDGSICYVVTDIKIPWHLPHGMDFIMVSKIVITYVDKAKSKLTVYTRLDWFKDPMLSKRMIEKQALEDLDNDALDLGDVVAEAIRKLGRLPQLHTAVTMFGGILNSPITSASATVEKPTLNHVSSTRIPIKHRPLSMLILENALSSAESAASSVIIAFVAVGKLITAHWVLLLLLSGSVIGNFSLSNRAGRAYWSERRADRFLKAIRVAPDGVMQRAITLTDLSDAIKPSFSNATTTTTTGVCWRKFEERAEEGDGPMGKRLGIGRQRLGMVRHDLVVALRVVNGIERDLVKAEWERWREDERRRCRLARRLLLVDGEAQGMQELERYCSDCEVDAAAGEAAVV
ncbi:hypothetical protein FN846DRAFT_972690 [Sphaerosporella brunnea]|nr:hypothetical protein FN846DRAFT_972690 [Sphaerosporella brunnea]